MTKMHKVNNIEYIKRDMGSVESHRDQNIDEFKLEIYRFFDEMGESDSAPIASSYAAQQALNYSQFLHSQLFPATGEWVQFINRDENAKAEDIEAVTKYLHNQIALGGFYGESSKMIHEGTLYNMSFLSTSYDKGLKFKSTKDENIMVSKDSNEMSMRGYISRQIVGINGLTGMFGQSVVDELNKDSILYTDGAPREYTVITAILPFNKEFFSHVKEKSKPYTIVHFIVISNEWVQIPAMPEECSAFPLVMHCPAGDKSLARYALAAANQLNRYELFLDRASELAVAPPMFINETLMASGKFNFDPNGYVTASAASHKPEPISTTRDPVITTEHMKSLKREVDEIFKKDEILRAKATNASQFEVSENSINMLKALKPSVGNLENVLTSQILTRCSELLKENDPKYRKLLNEVKGEFEFFGIQARIENTQKPAKLARALQAFAGYAQLDPSSAQKVDGMKVAQALFESYGCSGVLKSDEQIQKEQEAMRQQQEQQAQQEAMAAQADAQQKLSRGGGGDPSAGSQGLG